VTDERSPIQHHLVLHRIDPERRIARFYLLMIERDLFGTVRLVRNWGRIGTNGQEKVEEFATEAEAGAALEVLARRSGDEAIGIWERKAPGAGG
jgi:predicted DNA-binding WGR domain protein